MQTETFKHKIGEAQIKNSFIYSFVSRQAGIPTYGARSSNSNTPHMSKNKLVLKLLNI